MLLVMTDQRCVGFLLNRGVAGIEAFDADEISLGIFSNEHEAAAAIQGKSA